MIPLRRRTGAELDRLRSGPLRVTIVAETFLPTINGVTNSVLRIIEHLRQHGHEVMVIAPGPGGSSHDGVEVVRVRAFDLPGYGDVRVGLPSPRIAALLRDHRPDVVHLAAPALLGSAGVRAAGRLGIPSVAVYQTDLAGFARRHGLGRMGDSIWSVVSRIHAQADLTLAPSTSAMWALTTRGVDRVALWPRGVDLDRFHPRHRSEPLHRMLAPNGEVVVGYVGRLAREKQVERLAALCGRRGVSVVVIGDGPERETLERDLPGARFLGFQTGRELSRLVATLDVFVHTGLDETFCQSLQEAMASGVANVAPASGGPLDLVQHGRTGFLWSPEASETLVGAVDALVSDRMLRQRLGRSARSDAERRPWETVLDGLVQHYRSVAAEPYRRRTDAA